MVQRLEMLNDSRILLFISSCLHTYLMGKRFTKIEKWGKMTSSDNLKAEKVDWELS